MRPTRCSRRACRSPLPLGFGGGMMSEKNDRTRVDEVKRAVTRSQGDYGKNTKLGGPNGYPKRIQAVVRPRKKK